MLTQLQVARAILDKKPLEILGAEDKWYVFEADWAENSLFTILSVLSTYAKTEFRLRPSKVNYVTRDYGYTYEGKHRIETWTSTKSDYNQMALKDYYASRVGVTNFRWLEEPQTKTYEVPRED